jgi:hypothetical protein
MEELSSGESIRIWSSKSVRVNHYTSIPHKPYKEGLTDYVVKITSSRNSVCRMLVERSKVSTKRSMSLNIKSMLFSEDCDQCPI